MSTPTLPEMKRGDTFVLPATYSQDGTPVDLTAYTITAQIRDSLGALVEQLVVTKADQGPDPGVFTMAPAVNPPDWPVDLLRCDVQLAVGGVVQSSPTFLLPIVQDVTQP